MTEGVKNQETAIPEPKAVESLSDKELNFRRLEAAREQEREARIRAEMETQMLRKEIENIKTMLTPKEKDPLDEIEDISDLDAAKLRSILSQREAQIKREAEQIADKRIEAYEQKKRQTNFRDELRRQYNDYDQVMNEKTIASIQEQEPEAIEAITAIEDPYVRCEKAYHFLKKRINRRPPEEPVSIKEKVQENMQNPYHFQSGSGTPPPGAVDFDVRSKVARQAAYEKLKAAQRRPIGSGQSLHI